MNNISCVKLIVRISGRIWDVTVWSAPTAFLWIMGWLCSFPQMSVIITNVSRDNGRLSRLPRSSFYQLVQRDTVDELVIVMCDYASLRGQQTCRVFICCSNYGWGVERTNKHHNLLYKLWGLLSQKARFQTGLTLLISKINMMHDFTCCSNLNTPGALYLFLAEYLNVQWFVQSRVQCTEWEFIVLALPMTKSRIPFPFLPFLPVSSVHRWLSMHSGGWGGGGRGMLLDKRGRGELESLLHCNSEDAIKTCMNEKKCLYGRSCFCVFGLLWEGAGTAVSWWPASWIQVDRINRGKKGKLERGSEGFWSHRKMTR